MRPSIKTIASIGLALSLLMPAFAQAAGLTAAQVGAIISLLQSFGADTATVNSVQAALTGQDSHQPQEHPFTEASSTEAASTSGAPGQEGKSACIALTRNLGIGSQGDDVKSLQEMLAADPESGFEATTTGFFGPLTARAMMRFQENNSIASSTDGSVGPLTRGFFERHCGEGENHPQPMMGGQAGTSTQSHEDQ
ncbi:MAG: peptidoglycan-binding protein [Patescibacteria group bacterium]|nr:peptidoglycan-binding protein [Patescibacteria group bacterium]